MKVDITLFLLLMYYCLCSCSALVVKTVLRLLLHHTKFATCNLYNNILVKSTNQFLQCVRIEGKVVILFTVFFVSMFTLL